MSLVQVTFSADGTKLLAVDVDGNRYKLDALPKDPELLSTLTAHKVRAKFVYDILQRMNSI